MPPLIIAALAEAGAAIGGTLGAVLIMNAEIIANVLIAVSALGFYQYQKRQATKAYNASLQDRLVMVSSTNGVRSRVYGRARITDGVVFKAVSGDKNQYYTLVAPLAAHEIDEVEKVYFGDMPVTIVAGVVNSAPYGTNDKFSGRQSVTATSSSTSVTLSASPQSGSVYVSYASSGIGSLIGGSSTVGGVTVAGSVVTFPSTAGVSYTVHYQTSQQGSFALVHTCLGGPSQDLHALVANPTSIGGADNGSLIKAAHKFRGFACLVIVLSYDPTAFPAGVPAITALIRGAKDIYDPRTLTTSWTENPALCARDWALYANGGALSTTEIDDASFIAAANVCDISHAYSVNAQIPSTPGVVSTYVAPAGYTASSATVVDFTTGVAGSAISYSQSSNSDGTTTLSMTAPGGCYEIQISYPLTKPLYRCGYAAKLDAPPDVHMGELVEAMGGKYGWSGGRLKVKAGAYSAPAISVDGSWLAGGIKITQGVSLNSLVNVYNPTIADESKNYVPTPLTPLRADAYIAADGIELPQDLQLGAVTFQPQALHICGIFMRDQRQGLAVTLECNMRAFQLELFDVISLTIPRYGWSSKAFEVTDWQFTHGSPITLTLKETDASIFNPDAGFKVDDAAPNTLLPQPWVVANLTGLSAASGTSQLLRQADGSIFTRVLLQYDPINDQSVLSGGAIEVAYMRAGAASWDTQSFAGDSPSIYLGGLLDGESYIIKARCKSRLATGLWCTQIAHRVIGKTEAPPVPDAFTIKAMPDGTRLLEGGYQAATKPVDFAGYRIKYRQGAGPYTWAALLPFQTDDGFFTTLPIETNLLVAGTYTLALAGVDTTGNESAPLMIVGLLPNPRLGDALLYYSLESIDWPGTLTNGVHTAIDGASAIGARDQSTWAALPGTWAAWNRWAYDPVTSWTYQLNDQDLSAVVSVLPVVDIVGVGVFSIEEQHSTNGTAWSSWAAIAGSFTARYVRIRVSVSAAGPTGPGVTQYTYLTSMRVVYTGAVTAEVIEDLNPSALTGAYRIAVGDIRLPVVGTYATLRVESVVIQSSAGASAWTWHVVDKNTSPGPRIQFFNGGVLTDPPLIDATIKGIST